MPTHTAVLVGIDAAPLTLTVTPTPGQGFDVAGLPARHATETRVRIKSAVASLGDGTKLPEVRVTVPLSGGPARLVAGLDLPIALAALVPDADVYALGELSLSGDVQAVRGTYAFAELAAAAGGRGIIPASQIFDPGASAVGVRTLAEALEVATGAGRANHARSGPDAHPSPRHLGPDLAEVRLSPRVLRGLEIAATGSFGLLLLGPPGAGKTMIARRLTGILPDPNLDELRLARRIASAAGLGLTHLRRAFRAPHHTASAAALVGGGDAARPGEATLAHDGVLFLDEVTEFSRTSLAALRLVLEHGRSVVARGSARVTLPARPACVVAAANLCPCGKRGLVGMGKGAASCSCAPARIAAHEVGLKTLRSTFPLRLTLPSALPLEEGVSENSATVRERVTAARARLGSIVVEYDAACRIDDATQDDVWGETVLRIAIAIAALDDERVTRARADEALALAWGA